MKTSTISKALKYSDICLIPNYSECESRSTCDTSIDLLGKRFSLPIIPANMKSVIDFNLCRWMSENDYFYIMHRFNNDLADDVAIANAENWKTISFSIGVQDADKDKMHKIKKRENVIDFLTIDIAHGHCLRMKNMIEFIKDNLPDTKIIAGNVSTPQAVRQLAEWGADIVKVGIGQGSPCTTKDKTGFTMPMFSCATWCSNVVLDDGHKVPIIADGGIRCNGDIAKALVAGATMVMAGGVFAACTDSPALNMNINGSIHKAYYGSASAENKGHNNHIEGKLNHIQSNNMSFEEKLFEIRQGLQSSISYGGGNNLDIFQEVDYHHM
jgi:GMP reductase